MLEFEDTNVPIKAEVTAPTGFVVVPIEEYNKLLLAAANSKPVKIRKSVWGEREEIEALVDVDWLRALAVDLMKQRYSDEELAQYDIVAPDDVYNPTVTIAKRKPAAYTEPDPF